MVINAPIASVAFPTESSNCADKNNIEHIPLADHEIGKSPLGLFGNAKFGSPDNSFLYLGRPAFSPTPGANNMGGISNRIPMSGKSPVFCPPNTFGGYLDLLSINGSTPINNATHQYSFSTSPMLKSDSLIMPSPCFHNFFTSYTPVDTVSNENVPNKNEEQPK